MQYLLVIILVALLIFRWYWKRAKTAEERKSITWKALLWGLGITIFILAATGRIHWLGALFAGLFVIFKFLFGLLLRFFPVLAKIYGQKTKGSDPQGQKVKSDQSMDREEALKLLGLEGDPSESDIRSAHKRLIQKIHPDRGGNEYIASQLNQARDLLLKDIQI